MKLTEADWRSRGMGLVAGVTERCTREKERRDGEEEDEEGRACLAIRVCAAWKDCA